MTTAVFAIPYNRVKRDITVTLGVANTTALSAVCPEENVAILVDEASLDLTKLQSGYLYEALTSLADMILEKSAAFIAVGSGTVFAARCVNTRPKTSMAYTTTADAALIDSILQTPGSTVAMVVNPANNPDNRVVQVPYDGAHYLADYIREYLK